MPRAARMLPLARAGVAEFAALGDVAGRVDCMIMEGTALAWIGEKEASLTVLREATELAEADDYALGLQLAGAALGSTYGERSMLDEAGRHLQQSSVRGQKVSRAELTSLRALALIRHREGRHDESDALARRALQAATDLGLGSQQLLSLLMLAECNPGNPDLVRELLHQALAIADDTASRLGQALVYRGFAQLDLAAGRAEQARDRLLSALRVIREEHAATYELLALVPLALAHFALGDLAAARHVGEQARDVARRFGNAPAVELLTQHLDALDAASVSTP